MTALRFASISLGVYAFTLALLCVVSGVTAPSFAELSRVSLVRECEGAVGHLAQNGLSSLLAAEVTRAFQSAREGGAPLCILGGWVSLATRDLGAIDSLTAARFGWMGAAAFAPLALFWIVEASSGVALALLAVAILLSAPVFVHAAALGTPEAVLTGMWFLVMAAYVRALRRGRGRVCWSAGGAFFLGAGLAVDFATLWVVVPILFHFAWLRRRVLRRSLARGRVPVPSAVLFSLVAVPVVLGLLSPHVWRAKPSEVVKWALGSIATKPVAVLYHDEMVTEAPLYAGERLLASVSLLTAVLALVGVITLVRGARARRAERHHQVGWTALGAMMVAFVLFVWPLCAPLLAPFPPRVLPALPIVAYLAAAGLGRGARQVAESRWPTVAAFAVILLALVGLRDVPTAGAYFSSLVGGTARVAERRVFETGDGSEVGHALHEIDGSSGDGRSRASVYAPDVPAGYLEALHALGWARAELTSSKHEARAEYRLLRGHHDDSFAGVRRDGVVLWSLSRRGN